MDDYKKKVEDFLKEAEGFRDTVYMDQNKNPTIGYGFNLNAPGTKEVIQKHGIDPTALITGEAQLDRETAEKILKDRKQELDNLFTNRVKNAIPDTQIPSDILEFSKAINYNNPKLIGPNYMEGLRTGDREAIAREVLLRSNLVKDPGIQKRRLQEAELLMGEDFYDFVESLAPEEREMVSDLLSQIENPNTREEVFERYPAFKKEMPRPVQFKKLQKMLK